MSISRGLDKDVVYIYNGILLSHKKNKIISFLATWMDLEIIILTEVNQKKNKHHYDITYMWNLILKMIQINLFTKQKQTHRYKKQTYGY